MKWITGKVVQIKHWTKNLFSLIIHAEIDSFIAGQFTRLRLTINNETVQRAYSYVNPPNEKNLEFYLTSLPNGKMSSYLSTLDIGDSILINKKASGCFTIKEIPSCKKIWMLATGTAIGPYISILECGEGLDRFDYIILVHAVRYYSDLSYLHRIKKLELRYHGKLRLLTIVSREVVSGSLYGRIPLLIENGSIESSIGLKIDRNNSHVMLCGNPDMIKETKEILKNNYDMIQNYKSDPGHFTVESYW